MKAFLQKFALLVAGVLQGYDRLVFKGKLKQLYAPDAMHLLLRLNNVSPRSVFKSYAHGLTARILDTTLNRVGKERFRYVRSSKTDKGELAQTIAAEQGVRGDGLVCVLQSVEPCWTFDTATDQDGFTIIRGEHGKCSYLYHYYLHPQFGWMYARLQTWLPFEIQVGINGREWLARQMDREGMKYTRSDNKFLWVEDWQCAQQLLDEQTKTDWGKELDALKRQIHPLHPELLGRMEVDYNWTGYQTEFATDVAFHSTEALAPCFERWLRQAWLTYDSVDVLHFLGRSTKLGRYTALDVKTSQHDRFEGKRIKHSVNSNSLKMYDHANVLRVEMTINQPHEIRAVRRSRPGAILRPGYTSMWRSLYWGVDDMPQRAVAGEKANDAYLQALATLVETRTVQQLAEPLTRRVAEPCSPKPRKTSAKPRFVRGLNPLKAEDAALLVAISDPKWMVDGLKNRDLVTALYAAPAADDKERRRRSSRVTRLLRIFAWPRLNRKNHSLAPLFHTRRSPYKNPSDFGCSKRKPRPANEQGRMIKILEKPEVLKPSAAQTFPRQPAQVGAAADPAQTCCSRNEPCQTFYLKAQAVLQKCEHENGQAG